MRGRFILHREEAAELFAHANFAEGWIEIHRGGGTYPVVGDITILQHFLELLLISDDFEAVFTGFF